MKFDQSIKEGGERPLAKGERPLAVPLLILAIKVSMGVTNRKSGGINKGIISRFSAVHICKYFWKSSIFANKL